MEAAPSTRHTTSTDLPPETLAYFQGDDLRARVFYDKYALRDPDARDNHALFLRWRDALQQAGSLEAFYLDLFRQGPIRLPPLFIDLVAWAVVRNLLGDTADAQQVRAAELLFRPQRMVVHNGRVLAGDRETLDLLSETAGLGAVGRLLVQGGAAPSAAQLPVLDVHNASQYWETVDRFQYLFDLTHELTQDLAMAWFSS